MLTLNFIKGYPSVQRQLNQPEWELEDAPGQKCSVFDAQILTAICEALSVQYGRVELLNKRTLSLRTKILKLATLFNANSISQSYAPDALRLRV